jgi:hypothetical protein
MAFMFVGIHASLALAQPVSNYPFVMAFTGPEELVLQSDRWGLFMPDDGHVVFRRTDEGVHLWMTGGEGNTWLLTGPDFEHLAPFALTPSGNAIPVLRPSSADHLGPEFDAGYVGAYGGVFPTANGTDLLMVYHAERYPDGLDKLPSTLIQCVRWSIGLARSGDGGVTWTRKGQIIEGEEPFVSCTTGGKPFQGAGEPTVTYSPDGQYLYLYWIEALQTAEPGEVNGGFGSRVARAPIASDGVPGAWQKYYHGSFSQPGLGGFGTPVIFGRDDNTISFNTYLNRYVAVGQSHIAPTHGFVYNSSADGITWDSPRLLSGVSLMEDIAGLNIGDSWYAYPTFLSLDRPNQTTTGQTGYLYYAHGTKLANRPFHRDMVRRPVALLPDPGTGPLPLILSASVNQSAFSVGQALSVTAAVANPGRAQEADFYAGLLRPDGTIEFLTTSGSVFGSVNALNSFRPLATAVSLTTPFTVTVPNFYAHQWTGSETRGAWRFFLGVIKAGALAGGTIPEDAILGLATAPFSFP